VTGVAHMGDSLGDVPIFCGRINGDILSFIVTVKSPTFAKASRAVGIPVNPGTLTVTQTPEPTVTLLMISGITFLYGFVRRVQSLA
jgi:hypothetical protein